MATLNTTGEFYPKYKAKNANFDPSTFACAEDTVQELLTHSTTSEHPGMLLGKVQSGKTRTFISVLALAFDNGFNVAIILTKNSKPLVEQTRKRLESEFSDFLEDGEMAIYDIMSAPTSFTAFELESKLIFVAKKQDDNFSRLIKLFKKGCPALANSTTVIIDDEADSASVGYTKKDGLIEANKIAKRVSELREAIKSVSFIQVTATPYSLYLQPATVDVSNSLSFKPLRPKFTKVVPVTSAYVGGDTYFGDEAISEEPTVESHIHVMIEDKELTILKSPDKRRFKLDDVLTSPAIEGLRRAFVTFLVGGCIQRINGIQAGISGKKLRYSFLVHTEASKGSHDWQELLIDGLRNKLVQEAALNSERFVSLASSDYEDLASSIRLYGKPLPELKVVLNAVREALAGEHVSIIKVNSDEQIVDMLDSTGQLRLRSPLNVFIGGQVLDRGVTLANLIGFYYGRRPNKFQQDTVLQHSRMYGYRREDLAVTRFYTSNYIWQAMYEMEIFDSSLRKGAESGQEIQFIRQDGSGRIVPCSPNKILIATTQTIRPFRRFLPIGFQSGYKTHIAKHIQAIDKIVKTEGGFECNPPKSISLETAIELLELIEKTLVFEDDEDIKPFHWDSCRTALRHLANQHPDPKERDKVYLWAATGRNSARKASSGSHAKFIETPDSEKTEGALAKKYAINSPILFLLRQDGTKNDEWRGTPFYWPVVRAQANIPPCIYTAESLD